METLLILDVIEPAQTKWVSPVTFVQENHGTLPFFVYYRMINAVTTKEW